MGSKWCGVYPLDKIPNLTNGAYIINTQTKTLPGEHWLAINVDDNKISVMDPLGIYYPDKLVKSILQYKKKVQFSKIRYQDPLSNFCGHICLIWLASL